MAANDEPRVAITFAGFTWTTRDEELLAAISGSGGYLSIIDVVRVEKETEGCQMTARIVSNERAIRRGSWRMPSCTSAKGRPRG